MKTTYKVKKVVNNEIDSTYYWVIKTVQKKVFFGLRTVTRNYTIGSYLDMYAGLMPFFSKEKAEERIKNLQSF